MQLRGSLLSPLFQFGLFGLIGPPAVIVGDLPLYGVQSSCQNALVQCGPVGAVGREKVLSRVPGSRVLLNIHAAVIGLERGVRAFPQGNKGLYQ